MLNNSGTHGINLFFVIIKEMFNMVPGLKLEGQFIWCLPEVSITHVNMTSDSSQECLEVLSIHFTGQILVVFLETKDFRRLGERQ